MTCRELRDRIEAYARGTLSPQESAAFEAHLTTCVACSAFLEVREPRLAATNELPEAIEPGSDLWPGIRRQLVARHSALGTRRVMLPGWLLAAAALLLIVGSSAITAVLLRPASSAERRAPSAEYRAELETQYASATADLVAALEQARHRLAPATVATIERNLATIDSALAESRRALAADPGNAALEQLVVAVWRQKIDFLRRATALGTES
ncbi:MAG: zf-HC2 domain-containing protein [Gemmatimonadales bacterium]